jgi:hypothetical protein
MKEKKTKDLVRRDFFIANFFINGLPPKALTRHFNFGFEFEEKLIFHGLWLFTTEILPTSR